MVADQDDLISRQTAIERIRDHRAHVLDGRSTEFVTPGDGIHGRTLATDIVADADSPAHDVATMDGYALRAPASYPLDVVDAVYAEDDPPPMGPGEAVEIATGGRLPERANAVLRREDATVEDGRLSGPDLEPGTYTYRRGRNVSAGEVLFEAGERLDARDAILLAEMGVESVEVYEPFSVAVLATGSEIAEDASRDYDSAMLLELLRAWGVRPRFDGVVPDDLDVVSDRIETLGSDYDVVVTTGGTSVGAHDYVVEALDELGEILFHRVRVRPGKPLAVADLGGTTAIAIPGKPLGAYTATSLVARAFFVPDGQLPGVEATCPVAVDIGDPGFEYAIPVTLDGDEARPLGHVSSPLQVYGDVFDPSVLSSATRSTRADGMVLRETGIDAGETVTVVPYVHFG